MRPGNTAKLVSEEVIILASRLCRVRYVLSEDIGLPLSAEFTKEQREAWAKKKKRPGTEVTQLTCQLVLTCQEGLNLKLCRGCGTEPVKRKCFFLMTFVGQCQH